MKQTINYVKIVYNIPKSENLEHLEHYRITILRLEDQVDV